MGLRRAACGARAERTEAGARRNVNGSRSRTARNFAAHRTYHRTVAQETMTPTTNARIAGFTFLLYIVAGMASMAIGHRPHVSDLLSLLTSFCALLLGVTLYAITRAVDADLALLALLCRVIEAIHFEGPIFFAVGSTLFAWLLLRGRLIPAVIGWLGVFASALLAVILPLQRAGLMGGAGSWSSRMTWILWLPALVFELALAGWLLVKGVATAPRDKGAHG
jgi:hypothetical protein